MWWKRCRAEVLPSATCALTCLPPPRKCPTWVLASNSHCPLVHSGCWPHLNTCPESLHMLEPLIDMKKWVRRAWSILTELTEFFTLIKHRLPTPSQFFPCIYMVITSIRLKKNLTIHCPPLATALSLSPSSWPSSLEPCWPLFSVLHLQSDVGIHHASLTGLAMLISIILNT